MEKGPRIGEGRRAEVYTWGENEVLKLFHQWVPDTEAELEYRIASQISSLGIPVPSVSSMVEVEGRRGIIYERIDGVTMVRKILSQPWNLGRYARILARLQAQVHQHEVKELPDMKEQLERKIQGNPFLTEDIKKGVLRILHTLPDGSALCHGDLHPNNVLISSQGGVVIDWVTASRCNPLADAARTSLILSMRSTDPPPKGWLVEAIRLPFHRIYLEEYIRIRSVDMESIQAWKVPMAAARLLENIPGEEPLLMALIKKGLES